MSSFSIGGSQFAYFGGFLGYVLNGLIAGLMFSIIVILFLSFIILVLYVLLRSLFSKELDYTNTLALLFGVVMISDLFFMSVENALLSFSIGVTFIFILLSVGLSITTNSQNEENRKYWEPRTVPILKRLEAMQKMDSYGGVDLWVSAEPFLPGTDFDEYFQEIISYGGDSLHEIIIGKMNYEAGVDKVFEWGSVVRTCEEYRHKYKDRIRFHYKKEFMHFLERKHLTPWDLGIAPKEEFCVSEHNGRK